MSLASDPRPHRRQVDNTDQPDPRASEASALQRAATNDRRHLAEDADADLTRSRARRVGEADDLRRDSAARRVRTDAAGAHPLRAARLADAMGARQLRRGEESASGV